jgi:hypothetical protein
MADGKPTCETPLGVPARSSKDGLHALCARPLPGGAICGERIALIVCTSRQFRMGIVLLLSGYDFRPDGVYRINNHARRRWQADQRAAARGDRRAADRLSKLSSMRNRRAYATDEDAIRKGAPAGRHAPNAPFMWRHGDLASEPRICCPVCGMVNRLTPNLFDSA